MPRVAWQQGDADGLCALYALANFLRFTDAFADDAKEDPNEVLWYILEQCQIHGWFNPYYIKAGFELYQVKAIMDAFIKNYDMPYSTEKLSVGSCSRELKNISPGEAVICDAVEEDHWVLLMREFNGELLLWDSRARFNQKKSVIPAPDPRPETTGLVIRSLQKVTAN